LVTVLSVLHQKLGVGKPVGVDALCPFGGLETLGSLLSDGSLVQRVALSSVLLLVAAVVTALVFRRAFCGRICPLGYLQELFGGIGRKLFRRRPTLPRRLDRPARYLKYVVLAVLLYLSWSAAALIVRPYDPWVAYNHLSSAEVLTENGIGLAVLGVALVGSFVYDRFFCKYACPMGAFLGIISKFSLFKVRRSPSACIDCGACDKACPTNLEVSSMGTVSSAECIDCGECLAACPVKDALMVSGPGGRRPLTVLSSGVMATGLFALLVLGASTVDGFDWTVPTLGEQIERDSRSSAGATSAASFDTSLIKGSTTLVEVLDASDIEMSVFTRVYGVPSGQEHRQLKDLKNEYGCSPGEVRAFIEAYRQDPSVADSWTVGEVEESEGH
jgi:ferredoxin